MAKAVKLNPKVDAYLADLRHWQGELKKLRAIVLASGLTEDFKWGKPCYRLNGANLVSMEGMRDHCCLMFFKGALLQDPEGILQRPGENSQSMRVLPFTDAKEITRLTPALKACIAAAMAAAEAGLKIEFKQSADLEFPPELNARFKVDPALKAAFFALTPGRKRAYNLHFSGAKQSATRAARIDRCVARILAGKGIADS